MKTDDAQRGVVDVLRVPLTVGVGVHGGRGTRSAGSSIIGPTTRSTAAGAVDEAGVGVHDPLRPRGGRSGAGRAPPGASHAVYRQATRRRTRPWSETTLPTRGEQLPVEVARVVGQVDDRGGPLVGL